MQKLLINQESTLTEKLSSVNVHIRDLIEKMLIFNPHHRASAQDCLKSKLFDSVRNDKVEMPADEYIFTETHFASEYEAADYLLHEIEGVKK